MEAKLQETVGRRLQEHRHALGLSRESFAEVLGVHHSYVGGLEGGEHNLTLRHLERLARRLGLDACTLLSPQA